MKRWLGVLVALGLWGCQPQESVPTQPLVVVSSTILRDWVAVVAAGSPVQVVSLLQPGNDPHTYEPTPADSRVLAQARLILTHGHHLEPGIEKMVSASRTEAPHVEVGADIPTLQKPGSLVPDPHLWGDVRRSQAMVGVLSEALLTLLENEADQARIRANTDAYQAELAALHAWIPQQIQTIPPDQRLLVTTHDAFQYYSQAYGIPVLGTLIGISTEEQPSAQTVTRLITAIREAGIPTLFAESTLNPDLIATVAREANSRLSETLLYSDSLGADGSPASTYVGMMVSNTCAMVVGLGGTCTPFVAPALTSGSELQP
ncbi:MAG: zinc ABC transporter substrate-binding protein [Synechococcales cyanobacterium]